MPLDIITGAITPLYDYFKVIKAPPKEVLLVDVIDDSNFEANNLYRKLFQFKYRFVYDDNEKSVWSAISKIPIPAKSTDPEFNSVSNVQNTIEIKVPTGDINVYKIEIAGRVNIESNWSDFFLVDTLDKKRDASVKDNDIYTYIFRNDSVYVPIDIQESNLLFDYVPDEANALELANGNTLVVGGLKDGYNRDTVLDVSLTNTINIISPAVKSTLTASARNSSDTGPFSSVVFNDYYDTYDKFVAGIIKFNGITQAGDTISITIGGRNIEWWDDGIGAPESTTRDIDYKYSVTVQTGWGIPDIINAFINIASIPSSYNEWKDTINHPSNTQISSRPSRPFGVPDGTIDNNSLYFGTFATTQFDTKEWQFDYVNIEITNSYSFGESDSFPTYKWNGVYKFGLVYYDKDGKTNGVFTNPNMTLRTGKYKTDFAWTPIDADLIIPESETAQIYIGHEPPSWADYYHIVRTKELSCDFSLMAISIDTNISGGYVYLNIENIIKTNEKRIETSKVINYGLTSFVEGDRVRILQKYDTNPSDPKVIWSVKKILDIPIISIEDTGTGEDKILKLKIKQLDLDEDEFILPEEDASYVIEIYRPSKVLSDEDLTYYEIGYKFNVLTDTNGKRYHEGQQIVSGAPIEVYNITPPAFVDFYSSSKCISILFPTSGPFIPSYPDFKGLSIGDTISIQGSEFNDGIYTISNIDLSSTPKYIYVVEDLITESIPNANIILTKLTSPGKSYAYINMFNDGDYYYRVRTLSIDALGNNFGPLFVADKNFSETYLSAVWSQGRPLVVDENIKEEYYPAMLRFSQSYIPGTNINNLSRFYPLNFEEADASFGDILRLKTRENFIRLFQRFKTGMIPIYRSIIVDSANSTQVALSERLLNKPNYYAGEYGIDKYGSSLVSTDYGDYFIDTLNKAIVRASLDGITNVSDTYNLASWANDNIHEDSYGYGCFNYENRCVIMLVGRREFDSEEQEFNIVNKIVAYSESDKKFESFYGFTDAQAMFFANGFIYTFKGQLYIHDSSFRNKFYDVQQSATITTVNNGSLQLKKTYTAIELLSNELWTSIIRTGPLTNQRTSLNASDFTKSIGPITLLNKENKYNATLKRDELSVGGKFLGDTMKGCFASVELTNNTSSNTRLISVSLKYIQSPITNM